MSTPPIPTFDQWWASYQPNPPPGPMTTVESIIRRVARQAWDAARALDAPECANGCYVAWQRDRLGYVAVMQSFLQKPAARAEDGGTP